ncbi:T9SS type A sorting domain-containing protein [candidate division WOR-3 bacterium]|uniref:T9SS type A sorting domain-containing protein n=1 Tax=candidate division WOR-3 bacterium TaxID=2052148 RepID=A0A937XDR0_UNCW3|nr:T9SS type A sorting domain-containing protein [candidate division WOR-3 bacterium]
MEEGRTSPNLNSEVVARPNPFTTATTIRCAAPLSLRDDLRLYDAAGSLVRTLPAGGSRVLSGYGLKPGVYVLRAGEQSTRMVRAAD